MAKRCVEEKKPEFIICFLVSLGGDLARAFVGIKLFFIHELLDQRIGEKLVACM